MIKYKKVTLRLILQKNSQKWFEARLKSLKRGNITVEQKRTFGNITNVFNAWKYIIDLIDNFTTMTSEARHKAIEETKGKGIKKLTPK